MGRRTATCDSRVATNRALGAALEKPYVNPNSLGATYGEHRLRLELAETDWYRLRDLATSLGLEFMGSAWDRGSADLLDALDIHWYPEAQGCACGAEPWLTRARSRLANAGMRR